MIKNEENFDIANFKPNKKNLNTEQRHTDEENARKNKSSILTNYVVAVTTRAKIIT